MGSGKTTVGRRLAGFLGREFIDIDQELVNRTGVTISHIFEVEGEAGFRDRETRLLEEICERDGAVVSTGGGIIIRERNRELMARSGTVVFLDIDIETLWGRLCGCQNRPLLQVENPRQKVEQLMKERDAGYRQCADIVVGVSSDTANKTARRIQHLIEQGTAGQQ